MGIDGFTVAAQIVNFLVLAWLLKRFLYRPVVEAMQRREDGIARRLDQAAQRERQALAAAADYRDKTAALERERQAQLDQARDTAERERRDLLQRARDEARASRQRWQQELVQEQADFQAALVHGLAEASLAVARRALADLADTRVETQALATLARQLQDLPADQRQALADAAPHLRLATRFEPEAQAVDALRQVLADTLGTAVELECVRKPELLFGVELSGAGHQLDWSAASYLDDLAAQVRRGIDDASRAAHADAAADAQAGTSVDPGADPGADPGTNPGADQDAGAGTPAAG